MFQTSDNSQLLRRVLENPQNYGPRRGLDYMALIRCIGVVKLMGDLYNRDWFELLRNIIH